MSQYQHFVIDHKAPCLSLPQENKSCITIVFDFSWDILHNHCIRSLLGRMYYTGEIENNGYALVENTRCIMVYVKIMNIGMNKPINRLLQHVSKMQFPPTGVFVLTLDAYAERQVLIIPQLY